MLIQTDMAIITIYKKSEKDFDEMARWLSDRKENGEGRYHSVTKELLGYRFTITMNTLREFCKKFDVITIKGDKIA